MQWAIVFACIAKTYLGALILSFLDIGFAFLSTAAFGITMRAAPEGLRQKRIRNFGQRSLLGTERAMSK
jgi:hypothetical protein